MVLVGVTGGIAAYKAAEVVRLLVKRGYQVHVQMTEAATRFVTPLTFETLSLHEVGVSLWDKESPDRIQHTEAGREADLIVVAPATADFVGKLACGLADDLLSTTIMASRAPVLLFPSMNEAMFANPIVQGNLQRLAALGRYAVVEPDEGELACQVVGKGRLPEPQVVAELVTRALTPQRLAGRHVVVSAGATRAWMDDVRFLTNASTGRMGYALARAAWLAGARVTLVSGVTGLEAPVGVRRVEADTVEAMGQALSAAVTDADFLLMAAAVGDFAPEARVPGKIKKEGLAQGLTLKLKRGPDLLAGLARGKGARVFVGFAAESADHEQNALAKLANKGLDFLFLNPVGQPGAGFESPTNRGTLFSARTGRRYSFDTQPKDELAQALLARVLDDLAA
jgi:phosphopantothenoylcysteine decarboxylase/phosphopantothenate--cysteine ligase